MDTSCKWITIGIMLLMFIGQVCLAGCIHVVEFFGSIMIAIVTARLFYVGICKKHFDHLARR